MKKYHKKPVVIEAQQWFGFHTPIPQVEHFNTENRIDDSICPHCYTAMSLHGWIKTLEGGHIVCPQDWIIKGVKGEFYPCKPDIFEQTYEKVNK